jgi:predicted Abi (CAAX) family protease
MLGIAPFMQRPVDGKSGPSEWSLPWPRLGQIAIAFFLLFFLYVWFRIEPAVEYQHSSPVFLLTRSFVDPFLEYPGGLLDYAAAGLSQLNYYNWLGAVVFAVLGGLLWLGGQKVLAAVAGTDSRAASFGIPFLLLLLRERYNWPVLAMSTGLLTAIALALGYFRLFGNPRRTPSTPMPTSKEEASEVSPDREPSRLIAIPELFIEARRALRICSPQLL